MELDPRKINNIGNIQQMKKKEIKKWNCDTFNILALLAKN